MAPIEKSGLGPARLLQDIESLVGKSLPPVDQWNPPLSGALDIVIKRNGQWFYQGEAMERDAVVRMFSTILRKEEDGEYYLVTPVEKVRIQVEDAPFVAIGLRKEGAGRDQCLYITTNVGDEVRIDASHSLRVQEDPQTREPAPYVLVRGRLEALLSRAVYYELATLVEVVPEQGGYGVWSGGVFFRLTG